MGTFVNNGDIVYDTEFYYVKTVQFNVSHTEVYVPKHYAIVNKETGVVEVDELEQLPRAIGAAEELSALIKHIKENGIQLPLIADNKIMLPEHEEEMEGDYIEGEVVSH